MIKRWLFFALSLVAGAGIGWWLAPVGGRAFGLGCGLGVAAFFWMLLDTVQAVRLTAWLRSEQNSETPSLPSPSLRGVWGDLTGKIRRLLKARDQLHLDSQARLDEFLAAMQASPNGVVLLDAQGRIEWCNETASEHFGFDAQRDVMQHIANLVRDPGFKAYMAAGQFGGDVVVPGSASTPARLVKLSVHVHRYGKGRKLLLSRDITALDMAEAMRRDFVANVSHEIRTPLTVLSGFIETLQTLPLNEAERTRYLALMAQQSQRMQTLVSDLLTLSRLEGSPLPGMPGSFGALGTNEWVTTTALLAHCDQEARALSHVLAPRLGHQVSVDAGPASEIAGIHTEIYSAMSNLVANAVRYTPEGGRVAVSWTVLDDGRGRFEVKDSGPGIAPEHLPRLTERFYRIDRSRSRETGGTGLGLAIVKHVVQRHGAELSIESQPGQGSCFAIVFPAVRVRRVAH